MSAEALVESIINQALSIAADKADEASGYASQAVTASSGFSSFAPQSVVFRPGNVEPPVTIPMNAAGVDGALYGSTYDQIVTDLSDKFAGFFSEYFPNECDYLEKAQTQLCDML